jgi:hypothetical protein
MENQDRGRRTLLEKTLIVCLGEFGRTPGDITGAGRDHHRFAMSGCSRARALSAAVRWARPK